MYRPTPAMLLPADASYEQVKASVGTALAGTGHAAWPLPSCPLALEAWRRAARAAARTMGRPVRTHVAGDTVHAWLTDWPRDGQEEAIGVAEAVRALHDDDSADPPV